MVGTVPGNREPPVNPTIREVYGHNISKTGPRNDNGRPVGRGVHVVDELVVPFPNLLANTEEVRQLDGIKIDLPQPLFLVGNDVDPPNPGQVRRGSHHIRGALPVVPDEKHLPQGERGNGGTTRHSSGSRDERRDSNGGKGH